MNKKLLSIFVVLLVWINSTAFASTFFDVDKTHWAYDSIEKMVNCGVLNGYSDGSFKPNQAITKAEFSKIMVMALNLSGENGKDYKDVSTSNWAHRYIKIMGEYFYKNDSQYFYPNEAINRANASYVMVEVLGLADENIKPEESAKYSDFIFDWAKHHVDVAYKYKIMSGNKDGTFNASGNLTRAQVAQLICNVLDNNITNENYLKFEDIVKRIDEVNKVIENNYPNMHTISLFFDREFKSFEIDVVDSNGKSQKSFYHTAPAFKENIYVSVATRPGETYKVIYKNFVDMDGNRTQPNKEFIACTYQIEGEKLKNINKEFDIILKDKNKIKTNDVLQVEFVGELTNGYYVTGGSWRIKGDEKYFSFEGSTTEVSVANIISSANKNGIDVYGKDIELIYSIYGPKIGNTVWGSLKEKKTVEFKMPQKTGSTTNNQYLEFEDIIISMPNNNQTIEGILNVVYEFDIQFDREIESIDVDVINSKKESVLYGTSIYSGNVMNTGENKVLKIYARRNPGEKYTVILKNFIGKDGEKTKKNIAYKYEYKTSGQKLKTTKEPLKITLDIPENLSIESKINLVFNKELGQHQNIWISENLKNDIIKSGYTKYYGPLLVYNMVYSAEQSGKFIYGQEMEIRVQVVEYIGDREKEIYSNTFNLTIPKEIQAQAKEIGLIK